MRIHCVEAGEQPCCTFKDAAHVLEAALSVVSEEVAVSYAAAEVHLLDRETGEARKHYCYPASEIVLRHRDRPEVVIARWVAGEDGGWHVAEIALPT